MRHEPADIFEHVLPAMRWSGAGIQRRMLMNVSYTATLLALLALLGHTHTHVDAYQAHYTCVATIVSKDTYAVGAAVLARSLRATYSVMVETEFIAIVPQNSLRTRTREWLQDVGWELYDVDPRSGTAEPTGEGRTDLLELIVTKLYLWKLEQCDRVLYIDSDAFVVRKSAAFLWRDEYWQGTLTAIREADTGYRDIFKGGLLALKPSIATFDMLLQALQPDLKYSNADQGFLNIMFKDEWTQKPEEERYPRKKQFCAAYCALLMNDRMNREVYSDMIHNAILVDFQGQVKPWNWPKPGSIGPQCQHLREFAQLWVSLAFSTSDEHARDIINMFRFEKKDRLDLMEYSIGKAFQLISGNTASPATIDYFATVSRHTSSLMQAEFFQFFVEDTREKLDAYALLKLPYSQQTPFSVLSSPAIRLLDVARDNEIEKSIRLFCGVVTHEVNHRSNVLAVRDTWARSCDGFVFFSDKEDPEIPTIGLEHGGEESYDNLWLKHRAAWKLLYRTIREDFDWFFMSGDDVYVIVNNLRAYLTNLEDEESRDTPLYVGRPLRFKDMVYASSGSGFVLNRAALDILSEQLDSPSAMERRNLDDVMVGKLLKERGVSVHQATDEFGRESFHLFPPEMVYAYPGDPDDAAWKIHLPWYNSLSINQPKGKEECCSARSISFHMYDGKIADYGPAVNLIRSLHSALQKSLD